MLHREINSNLRENDITENPYFNIINCDKRNILFHPSTPMQVNKLGSFIKQSSELRTGDSRLFLTCDVNNAIFQLSYTCHVIILFVSLFVLL